MASREFVTLTVSRYDLEAHQYAIGTASGQGDECCCGLGCGYARISPFSGRVDWASGRGDLQCCGYGAGLFCGDGSGESDGTGDGYGGADGLGGATGSGYGGD